MSQPIPEIRFPQFTGNWLFKSFGEILHVVQRPIQMRDHENYSLVTVKRRAEGVVSRGDYKGKQILVKSQYRLEEGDFLISKRQIVHNAFGLVPKDLHGAIVSNEYSVLLPKEDLDIVFFDYYCKRPKIGHTFYLSSIGVHIEKMLFKLDDWFKWKFCFPSLPEQTRIASFLTAVDKRIALLQKKKEALEQYKKGVMQKLFTLDADGRPSLRFKDDYGRDYPAWEEKKLGDVCEIVGGGTPDTTREKYWNGEIDWYTPTEIKKKYLTASIRKISEDGLRNSSAKKLPEGTLLFTSRATIGDVGVAIKACTTNQGFQSFIPGTSFEIEFLYYWILHNRKLFIRRSSGSTFLEISKKEIQKIIIKLPSLPEQHKFASFLSSLDVSIDTVGAQIEASKAWKNGLLQKMFV